MPELPDVSIYLECLEPRIRGVRIENLRIENPFLLRSVEPEPAELLGKRVRGLSRLGKRLVLEFEEELFAVLHLMIAGRLRWRERGVPIPRRVGLASFDFESGSLLLTEQGTKRRASLHLVRGEERLAEHDRGGLEVLDSTLKQFRASLLSENHTLKRALTDPRIFSGIGNAYSDEILHRARLSPLQLSQSLDTAETKRLHAAVRTVLAEWIERLRAEVGAGFPEKVTAFRPGMSVHGRFNQPCPVCGAPIQRIVYASNETNYCPACQTGGRILSDRALARLLKEDWPKTLEELEERKRTSR